MLVLYGLAYLYDSLFKRNVTGNFPSHEANHHRPRIEYKVVKGSKKVSTGKETNKRGKGA